MNSLLRHILLGVLAVTNVACTPKVVKALIAEPPPGIARTGLIKDVPFFPQTDNYCGPSSVAMVLKHYDKDPDLNALIRAMYVPGLQGTLQAEVKSALRTNGMLAYQLPRTLESLLKEIDAGQPVVVLQNLGVNWYPKWHYAVVVGYDLDKKKILLHSGKHQNRAISVKKFALTWARGKNWGIIPLPPGKLPASEDANGVFLAMAELSKQIATFNERARLYQSGIERWPSNEKFSLALGNLYHEIGDYDSATDTLIKALEQGANSANIYNNLAYGLVGMGCRLQAIDAISCAVSKSTSVAFLESRDDILSANIIPASQAGCPDVALCKHTLHAD